MRLSAKILFINSFNFVYAEKFIIPLACVIFYFLRKLYGIKCTLKRPTSKYAERMHIVQLWFLK